MKKALHIAAKVLFTLLLISPILGVLGVMPEPTRELYHSDVSFSFISALMDAGYVMWMMAVVNVLAIVALWTRREALAALLMLPITLNIIAFHLVLDGGLFTAGAVMADVLFLLNAYLLYRNRKAYQPLLQGEKR